MMSSSLLMDKKLLVPFIILSMQCHIVTDLPSTTLVIMCFCWCVGVQGGSPVVAVGSGGPLQGLVLLMVGCSLWPLKSAQQLTIYTRIMFMKYNQIGRFPDDLHPTKGKFAASKLKFYSAFVPILHISSFNLSHFTDRNTTFLLLHLFTGTSGFWTCSRPCLGSDTCSRYERHNNGHSRLCRPRICCW